MYLGQILAVKAVKKSGAEDGGRTRTVVTYRRILSPVRLPIPPPRHENLDNTGFLAEPYSYIPSSAVSDDKKQYIMID